METRLAHHGIVFEIASERTMSRYYCRANGVSPESWELDFNRNGARIRLSDHEKGYSPNWAEISVLVNSEMTDQEAVRAADDAAKTYRKEKRAFLRSWLKEIRDMEKANPQRRPDR